MRKKNFKSALKLARTSLNKIFTVFTTWLFLHEPEHTQAIKPQNPQPQDDSETGDASASSTGAPRHSAPWWFLPRQPPL